jgi:GNAT superfamily N-acetyltransferase
MMSTPKPWTIGSGPAHPPAVPGLRQLSAAWRDQQVRDAVYTPEEMDALESEDRVVSWAAPEDRQHGPYTFLARSEGRIVAGVELWQQQRDRYWFLEVLVRDQSPRYKGVGHELVDAALEWLAGVNRNGYGVRVHAMAREDIAVRFWTRHLNREADFTDAFIRSRTFHFPAVGWVIAPGDDLLGQLISALQLPP